MIDKIKKNWKTILIGVLTLFGVNQCATRCSWKTDYQNEKKLTDSLTTVVNNQAIQIDKLITDTSNYINQIRMYTTFEMKRDKQDSINNANIKAQKQQTDALIQKMKNR